MATEIREEKVGASGRDSDDLVIALPEPDVSLDQDAEWCVYRDNDGWHELRFHDYDAVYSVPGLYEHLFHNVLKCESPRTIRSMLEEALRDTGLSPQNLRVLDLGAGNGLVGEQLLDVGAETLAGVDIIPEARDAALRDRPEVYDEYVVGDIADLPAEDESRIRDLQPNCLVCVAALGFGDIPPEAFAAAFNMIEVDGWVAFNIKDCFLSKKDQSGFSRLVQSMIDRGILEVVTSRRYRHRNATNGEALHYVAIIGRKRRDVAI